MAPTYTGEWKKHEDVRDVYDALPAEPAIVFAGYDIDCYQGSALVVWELDGAWFENNDSHCSCYGLENWEPEKTSADALLLRTEWEGLHEAVRARVATSSNGRTPDSGSGNGGSSPPVVAN